MLDVFGAWRVQQRPSLRLVFFCSFFFVSSSLTFFQTNQIIFVFVQHENLNIFWVELKLIKVLKLY